MITLVIADDEGKVKELLAQMLAKTGNTKIDVIKQEDVNKIIDKGNLKSMVSLEEKIIELEDSLYNEKKGRLYKSILEVIEKPLIEHMLERSEGNQLRAARILGINRNTIRAKIKKLGIDPESFKVIINE